MSLREALRLKATVSFSVLKLNFNPGWTSSDMKGGVIVGGGTEKRPGVVREAEPFGGYADPVLVEFLVAVFVVIGDGRVGTRL